jgi:hypothetical protein
MRLRVFTNSLYFEENLNANLTFIEITAFIWMPHYKNALLHIKNIKLLRAFFLIQSLKHLPLIVLKRLVLERSYS